MDWYNDVFDLVYPDVDPAQANSRWKAELAKPAKGEEDGAADEINPAV